MIVVTELGHKPTLRNWGMRRGEKVEVVRSPWADSLTSSNAVVTRTVVDSAAKKDVIGGDEEMSGSDEKTAQVEAYRMSSLY